MSSRKCGIPRLLEDSGNRSAIRPQSEEHVSGMCIPLTLSMATASQVNVRSMASAACSTPCSARTESPSWAAAP